MDHPVEEQEILEYSNEDAAALFSHFAPPPAKNPCRLEKPMCLPRLQCKDNAPFLRAYSDELRKSGIEMDDWIKFIDGLNLAMTASPPLRVVGMAGWIVAMIPYHWAMIAGAAIQISTGTSVAVLAKTLTDRYLQRANKGYFAPRGLRVRLCKTAAMRQLIGLDPTPAPDAPPTGFGKKAKAAAVQTRRIAERAVLRIPMINFCYNRFAPKVQTIQPNPVVDPEQNSEINGATARRLGIIADYTLPLRFDVPGPEIPKGIYEKASGLSVRLDTWRAKSSENDKERKRQLLAVIDGRAPRDTITPPKSVALDAESEKKSLFKKMADNRAQHKDVRSYEKTMRQITKGKGSRRVRAQVQIADRLEYKTTQNLVWLVLLNEEQDTLIGGTQVVDSDEEVEVVPSEVWKKEVNLEETEHVKSLEKADEQLDCEQLGDDQLGGEQFGVKQLSEVVEVADELLS